MAQARGRKTRPSGPPATAPERWSALGEDERTRLERALSRIAAELSRVLGQLGSAARATELEKRTGLGRATVHRVLALARTPRDKELEGFDGAPGPEALESFVKALGPRALSSKQAGELKLAIAQYRRVLAELGGSQAVVRQRVQQTRHRADADPKERAERQAQLREQLFHQVAELLGRQCTTRLDVMLFKPCAGDPERLDFAQVRGIIGYRGRSDAQPLSVDLLERLPDPEKRAASGLLNLDGKPAHAELSSALLGSFSTTPPPIVLSQGLGARVRNIIDPALTREGQAVDFVVGYQRRAALRHPRSESHDRTLEVGALHRDPARHLVVDLWLERSVAVGAVPDLAAYLWSPTLETSLADHWTERLPLSEPLHVLGQGLSRAATPGYARHQELTAHTFARLGWDANAFVGFRAEIAFPLWGGAYFITLDYG